MTKSLPERVDKINYYTNLPLEHLLSEASCAETILKSTKPVSDEKIYDSKLILDELNKRISSSN